MLNTSTAHELLVQLHKGQIRHCDILSDIRKRIDRIEPKIKAFVKINPDIKIEHNVSGVLSAIPIAIKDNICVKDEESTCASRILQGFKAPYDATVIEKLKSAGAVLQGKTNMDEFAFGSSCENSFYGPTHNPWNIDNVPGGSSGGSAAAVSADESIFALGSDTGGSIRQPASFCGVVGMKPTYGRVSRYGLIAFASSLDQIGPITKDVSDCALLLKVISGYDKKDSTSADLQVPDYTKTLTKNIKGVKIGVPQEYFPIDSSRKSNTIIEGIDKDVSIAMTKALDVYRDLGAKICEISLPHTEYAVSVYYIIATAEASSNLARFDGVQYAFREDSSDLIDMYKKTRGSGFGQEAKRRIILGTYVLSHGYYDAYYLRALKVRTLIKNDFINAFKKVDCIITPTSPTTAFRIGERADNPLAMYLSDIFTISANLSGIPGLSIPCGFDRNNLPIGLQILGKAFEEELILNVAFAYEQGTEWHLKKPNL